MKIYVLGSNPDAMCFVVHFKGSNILLDCGAELRRLVPFFPRYVAHTLREEGAASTTAAAPTGKAQPVDGLVRSVGSSLFLDSPLHLHVPDFGLFDLANIDAILISNCYNMLALPYITEFSDFRGRVIATEATVQTGRQMMEEWVAYCGATPGNFSQIFGAPLPSYFNEFISDPHLLKECYTMKDVDSCVSRIQGVSFGEQTLLGSLRLTAVSSGHSLGSALWHIQTEFQKVTYIPDASSVSSRHPEPLDLRSLHGADAVILCHLASPELPATPEQMLERALQHIGATLKEEGNVLLPVYPSGFVYDLIELVSNHLSTLGLATTVPMYFVSPVAETSLAYSNICPEWLCKPKQDKAYLPEPPFVHADLLAKRQLVHFPDISAMFAAGFRQPCIVFAGHPSLRCGSITSLLKVWGSEPKNAIIFTEPDYNPVTALAPFQPLALKIFNCPVDTRLSFAEANALLRDIKPKHIIVPASYYASGAAAGEATARTCIVPTDAPVTPFSHLDIVRIPLRRKYERGFIAPKLAQEVEPSPVGSGVRMAEITALLSSRDDNIQLEGVQLAELGLIAPHKKRRLYGVPRLDSVLAALEERGVRNVRVTKDEHTPGGFSIDLPSLSALLRLSPLGSHIETDVDASRHLLREVIVSTAK